MDIQAVTTLVSVLIGGGVFGFVEYLIKRHDEKKSRKNGVLKAISDLDQKVDERFNELDQRSNERFDIVNAKIDEVDRKGDERNAVAARVRILRFADELMGEKRHSKDSWDQVMSDADEYEDYCSTHPDFKNNQTAATVAYIKKGYSQRLEKHDFL